MAGTGGFEHWRKGRAARTQPGKRGGSMEYRRRSALPRGFAGLAFAAIRARVFGWVGG